MCEVPRAVSTQPECKSLGHYKEGLCRLCSFGQVT